MKLTWLGTAGFQVQTGGSTFLIDPYLSRNPQARPVQSLQPDSISDARQIFISHGHFDHLYDVPAIMARSVAEVHCSQIAAITLKKLGVDGGRLHAVSNNGYSVNFRDYRAQAFYSRHVKFDIPQVARALMRIGRDFRRLIELSDNHPAGQVLSWRFTIGEYAIHHFGSAGSSLEELALLAEQTVDLLLVPLQGHTHICDIAFEYVRMLKPRLVIPHHQDDFYPPVSTAVSIDPFLKKVKSDCPQTEVRVLSINETIIL